MVTATPITGASASVRTRFAPSPTGFLHIGGARTALFSWAFARHHGGVFILRIEDTDLERSTPQAVQAILDGMQWLGLDYDEGPYYQMQRIARYREVIAQMLAAGTAYHCYCSREELDAMRAAQEARGEKPRYDGRWRPEPNKSLPPPPPGVPPVVRFKNPPAGDVGWDDLVKGPIAIANAELDDLIIARADGTPTYNFCVVVDDFDMAITHVIRGDDHVNNTPRQINILRALGATVPVYGHVPMIFGMDGQKLSKRHGAVSVMQYAEDGYAPEAVINYLARLGWSHGDSELFSRAQMVRWFDGAHINRSPAKFDFDKLKWLNNQYLRSSDDARLAEQVVARLIANGLASAAGTLDLPAICALMKERAATLVELTELVELFIHEPKADQQTLRAHVDAAAADAVQHLAERLASVQWDKAAIAAAIKQTLAQCGLKMPQLAVPVRWLVFGVPNTPSLDAMLALLPRQVVIERLGQARRLVTAPARSS